MIDIEREKDRVRWDRRQSIKVLRELEKDRNKYDKLFKWVEREATKEISSSKDYRSAEIRQDAIIEVYEKML